ncbi:dTDP-4-dehydrorhamnose 3,5-epimerase [Amycolatopsis sp. PS_44_ISF1]|uniref:dTDP-4-dehydrorhamnose 3,5-epimerase family protein n=1 Tax=Amycolatopsis sp. PS_44_ISF1 TaxID=2974917 RepID=UPI0028DE3086|nr:dTDP-4-dehydrorhamnose 3,5-epimerase [Amycolatopsis sp. PS_44_ISF1]MDT8911579.1 dTDP-4-dehydrorhamnose 3,5-epimerase [Amycolatopsis sp. PS_44_ISF1]
MQFRPLKVPDAYAYTPSAFPDERGLFAAPFQEEALLGSVGHPLRMAQVNHSVSRRGTIRGVHFADTPPGQAKYVYCPAGALLDVIVDLRTGSPTFGQWDSVLLDAVDFRAVYVAEGLGHAFIALEDDTAMAYLCSEPYNPSGEHGISPLDPALALPWPADVTPIVSEKDRSAPTLAEARARGLLPSYDDCTAYYEKLRSAHR